jgi:hypothetical protein
MALDTAKRNQIKRIFVQFIRNRMRTIRRLKIEDLNINPFLIRILAKEMGNFKSDFEVMASHLTRAYNKLNETNQSLLKVEARFESVLLPEKEVSLG